MSFLFSLTANDAPFVTVEKSSEECAQKSLRRGNKGHWSLCSPPFRGSLGNIFAFNLIQLKSAYSSAFSSELQSLSSHQQILILTLLCAAETVLMEHFSENQSTAGLKRPWDVFNASGHISLGSQLDSIAAVGNQSWLSSSMKERAIDKQMCCSEDRF